MNFTIMVADIVIRFELLAINRSEGCASAWQLDVETIHDVTQVLMDLGFMEKETASRLTKAGSTVTPQPGVATISLSAFASLDEILEPEKEPPSAEAQDSYMLVVHGETTEERLIEAGFTLKPDGPLQ